MPIIKRSCIENIKARVSIYDVVLPYVQLKRSGASWRGLSPFTQEKTPSFYAIPQKNIFKCFSSGYAGDIFKFIQLKENLNFNEAVETLAKRFDIPLEYEHIDAQSTKEVSLKKEIFAIHEQCTAYFHKNFYANTPQGQIIRDYFFKERGFSEETAKMFNIGYAPVQDIGLLSFLNKHNFSFSSLKQSGLFYSKEQDQDPRYLKARFSGRLMIPIRDIQGRTIAFTARVTPLTPKEDPAYQAKYINSPETPIFIKSHVLFGLDHARKHVDQIPYFVLVEGQLDVLRCIENGILTAIAPQGTSITEGQLSLIHRYTSKIECLLDGDNAGQKAALRLLPMALHAGLEVIFLPLPQKADPDSFFREKGLAGYQICKQNAIDPMTFAYNALVPKHPPSPQEKTKALESIYGMLSYCESAVAQQSYIHSLVYLAQTDKQAIQSDFSTYLKKHNHKNNAITSKTSPSPVQKTSLSTNQKLTTAEYELLLVLLHYDKLVQPVASVLDLEWLDLSLLQGRLLSRFINEIQEEMRAGLSNIEELLQTEEEYNYVYTLLAQPIPFSNPIQTANVCIKNIFTGFVEARKKMIESSISQLHPDDPKLRILLEERLRLRKAQQQPPQIESSISL